MINTLATTIVDAVKMGHRQRFWLSGMALLATLLVACAYLMVGALRARAFASTYEVSIELPESGGLIPEQDVALRGMRVGRVDSVTPSPRGPIARDSYRIRSEDSGGNAGAGVRAFTGR